jgi:ankyrin repeat protein
VSLRCSLLSTCEALWKEHTGLGHNISLAHHYWYALRDDIAAMRTILQHGAEVNLNTYYEKPLQQSAQRNLDTVRLLVEHGADDEERDYAWNTPLHMAAAGKTEVVRFLVERWTEGKEALNNHGKTPLSRFEEYSTHMNPLRDEKKEEIIALLGGPYSEANND